MLSWAQAAQRRCIAQIFRAHRIALHGIHRVYISMLDDPKSQHKKALWAEHDMGVGQAEHGRGYQVAGGEPIVPY